MGLPPGGLLVTCPRKTVPPNQRMKLTARGGRLKRNGSILSSAATGCRLCAIPLGGQNAGDHFADICFVPQNAINIELCLRLTNGKPALPPQRWRTGARWIDEGETMIGWM